MSANLLASSVLSSPLVQVFSERTGQFTAKIPGIPELSATAPTREQAIEQLRRLVGEWLSSGQLVSLLPTAPHRPPGWAQDDPLEQEFLEELYRMRQADLERTLSEYEEEDRSV